MSETIQHIPASRQLQLLPDAELLLRVGRVKDALRSAGCDSILVSDNANLYYLTGRVIAGYVYLHVDDPLPYCLLRRPADLEGDRVSRIERFADIRRLLFDNPEVIDPKALGLELDLMPYSMAMRLSQLLEGAQVLNASGALRQARSVKTPMEQALMRESGLKHEAVYRRVPGLWRAGMTDLELQVEIERLSRLEGCLGVFRAYGRDMEIYMGNVLTGDNADTPSPYDFAMGGAGLGAALPGGANGSVIRPGQVVMVDVNGNYNGYMTDMTRCFAPERPSQKALDAHRLSIDIVHQLTDMARPGAAAADLYKRAEAMVQAADMQRYFMGHRTHAPFVGHGVGIEINEMPVIAPRSRDVLEAGNTIAFEPKFVLPGVGAVGIENTVIVQPDGPAQTITTAPEDIIYFE